MTHVNIDGDVILYAAGFAAQETVWTTDSKNFPDKADAIAYADKYKTEEPSPLLRPEGVDKCLASVKRMLHNIKKGAGADTYTVLLSGSTNFREAVATIQPYKGHRADAEKPYHYQNIKEYLINYQRAEVCEGEEADDQLSIRCYKNGDIIATIDKDLDNTPGWHYNWNKQKLYEVHPVEADRNFYKQLLTGDATDHIPGLFRLTGTRASAKMKARIDEETTPLAMYEVVATIYVESLAKLAEKMGEEYSMVEYWEITDKILREIGPLLWMRRLPDEMWEPPYAED